MHTFEPIPPSIQQIDLPATNDLKFLTLHQVIMLDEALCSIGEYGEVRLVISKGRLRFLVTCSSEKVSED